MKNSESMRCYIDDAKGSPHCVFDDGAPEDCDEAFELAAQGLCKKDCQHWRHPDSVVAAQVSAAQANRVRIQIRADAATARQAQTANELKFACELASTAPEFIGSFGHGHFVRPKSR